MTSLLKRLKLPLWLQWWHPLFPFICPQWARSGINKISCIQKLVTPLCWAQSFLAAWVPMKGSSICLEMPFSPLGASRERHLTKNSWHETGATDISSLPLGTSLLSKKKKKGVSQSLHVENTLAGSARSAFPKKRIWGKISVETIHTLFLLL